MKKELVIIGASGHGKVVADIAKKTQRYEKIYFLDDNESVKICNGYEVVGKTVDFGYYLDCAEFFVAIGNASIRKKIFLQLKNSDAIIATLCHPSSVIADDVQIGCGTVVMAGTVINSGTVIGNGCIINTCSSVDHDCQIDDFVHVSVGAHLAGTVTIGQETMIGAGATVINNIGICSKCMIGAGAVIIKGIEKKGTYVGIPAIRISDFLNE